MRTHDSKPVILCPRVGHPAKEGLRQILSVVSIRFFDGVPRVGHPAKEGLRQNITSMGSDGSSTQSGSSSKRGIKTSK